ncbi:MAG: hypothetical protein M3355_05850 [Actinomycetota bacterium]|nr:hypothetical protein [Actinomycetota bacterium]
MVRNAPAVKTMTTSPTPPEQSSLEEALSALEGIEALRGRLAGEAWLVGGAVRDLLRGETRTDLDIAVEGDVIETASLLGTLESTQEEFGTASVVIDGVRVDIAGTRMERYAYPGALPEVQRTTLAEDLARRDFTVNAMAIPLLGAPELIDPHGGQADLDAGLLRVLHPRSFSDDPTRALRAARYAARLGLDLEPETADLLASVDLGTVSADRVRAELRRTLAEESGPDALALLSRWGLAGIDEVVPKRVLATRDLLAHPDWADVADLSDALLAAATQSEPSAAAERLVKAGPERPSEGVALTRGVTPLDIVAARVAGAHWLDDWAREWRRVALEIDGTDLLDRGIPQGPALGRGLEAALRAKLDGETSGRDDELRIALRAAS